MPAAQHTPVLVEEVLAAFTPASGSRLLDLTVGHGGHAAAYLERTADSTVVGLDADAEALAQAKVRLAAVGGRVQLLHANFAALGETLAAAGIDTGFQHILLDLGIGSHQLADAARGFSFQHDGPLTMRYGVEPTGVASALPALNWLAERLQRPLEVTDLLTGLKADSLAEVLRTYGEERYAGRIARVLTTPPVPRTSAELAQRVADAVPASYRHGRLHPATRTFQALRLAVNRELEALTAVLPQAVAAAEPGGVLAVISFHSLEDRIVKNFFRNGARTCVCPPEQPECTCATAPSLELTQRKAIRASETEVAANPRARSARLRYARIVAPANTDPP